MATLVGWKKRPGRLPFADAEVISGVLASRRHKTARQKPATVKTSNLYSLATSERILLCRLDGFLYAGLYVGFKRGEFLSDN